MLRRLLLSSALFSSTTVFANGFIAGTPIRTVDSYKSIDQICEGDIVLACDTEYCAPRKVTRDAKVYGTVEIYNVATVDGNSVFASELQKFYVLNQGWTLSSQLEIGDKIIHSDQGAMEISK